VFGNLFIARCKACKAEEYNVILMKEMIPSYSPISRDVLLPDSLQELAASFWGTGRGGVLRCWGGVCCFFLFLFGHEDVDEEGRKQGS
jgi:hypothetical protein